MYGLAYDGCAHTGPALKKLKHIFYDFRQNKVFFSILCRDYGKDVRYCEDPAGLSVPSLVFCPLGLQSRHRPKTTGIIQQIFANKNIKNGNNLV